MHRPFLVGLVALAIALAAACSEPEPTSTPEAAAASPPPAATPAPSPTPASTPTPTPTPEPTATPTPLSISAKEVLEASFAAMQAVETLHFQTEVQIALTVNEQSLDVPIGFVGDFQAPDRFQGTISVTIIFLVVESQIVGVGGTTYATDPRTGEWKVIPGGAPFFVGPSAIIDAAYSEFQDAVVVG